MRYGAGILSGILCAPYVGGDMDGDLGGYLNGELDGDMDGDLGGSRRDAANRPRHRGDRGAHQAFDPSYFQQILPVTETAIVASGQADISVQPQRGFRPMRIVVPSTIGPLFKVSNVSVGQDPQFVSPGVVYCEVMSEVAVGVGLKGTKAHLGNLVTVTAINRDTANTNTFSATIFGITSDA
jgi:hypothetical protein